MWWQPVRLWTGFRPHIETSLYPSGAHPGTHPSTRMGAGPVVTAMVLVNIRYKLENKNSGRVAGGWGVGGGGGGGSIRKEEGKAGSTMSLYTRM